MKLIRTKQPKTVGVGVASDSLASDRFSDPVEYLAGLGIEAELVSEEVHLPEAA